MPPLIITESQVHEYAGAARLAIEDMEAENASLQ